MRDDLPLKDWPGEPACEWKTLDEPEGRHLAAELIPVEEFLSFGKLSAQAGASDSAGASFDSSPTELPDFLAHVVGMYRPKVVLELGSGEFTPILASKVKTIWEGASIAPRYITITHKDQDAAALGEKIKQAKLNDIVKSLVFPLVDYRVGEAVEGNQQVLTCYDFNENRLFEMCAGLRPDMLIINGPDTADYVLPRMLTVPILSQYLQPGALVCVIGGSNKIERVEIESWVVSEALHPIGAKAISGGVIIGQIKENNQNIK